MNWLNTCRRWMPRPVRHGLQRWVSLRDLKLRQRERQNPLSRVFGSDVNTSGSSIRFGIVRNSAQYHTHFVQACLDMGHPFRVLDLYGADWLDQVTQSGCDVLLVWPDAVLSSWNRSIKDRILVLEEVLGYPSVPSSREIWMYEDKARLAAWLAAHGIPHPRTWVFLDRDKADSFAKDCALPIVFKTNFGASASGVRILRSRHFVRRVIRRAFGRGIVPDGFDYRDRQVGSVLFQEYLPNVREWRMVRIGDSYFGHPKGRVGDFHSGSGAVEWEVPDGRHLDLLHQVTERGGFRSMNVDIFETEDGRLLVNELQAVFGAGYAVHQLRVDGAPGRFLREGSRWVFEAGDFARNACANERIRDALVRGLCRRAPRWIEAGDSQGAVQDQL